MNNGPVYIIDDDSDDNDIIRDAKTHEYHLEAMNGHVALSPQN